MEATHPLKAYRERAGIKQHELAERLGVVRQTLARWEQGKRWPQRRRAEMVARVTGIPLAELLELAPSSQESRQ